MIDYKDLDNCTKRWLEQIASEDKYGLSPQMLYKNIYNSTGDDKQLSKIFTVPIWLIRAIRDNK